MFIVYPQKQGEVFTVHSSTAERRVFTVHVQQQGEVFTVHVQQQGEVFTVHGQQQGEVFTVHGNKQSGEAPSGFSHGQRF